jgi:hypothetical protein
VIEPISRRVRQVDGEELDDQEVIVHPACPACKVVVHQLGARIVLAITVHDVVGCTETPKEARIAHIAPEHFRSSPLRAKAAPAVMQIARAREFERPMSLMAC